MANTSLITYTDPGVIEALKSIFGGILVGGLTKSQPDRDIMTRKMKNYSEFMGLFKSKFPVQVFRDEYAVLYEIIHVNKSLFFTKGTLRTLMESSQDRIFDSPYIDMSAISTNINGGAVTDDEKFQLYYTRVAALLEELSRKEVTKEEFESACILYIDWFKDKFMFETVQNMSLILGNGFEYQKTRHRRQHLKGKEDAQRYYSDRMAILASLDEESAIKHEVLDADAYNDYQNGKTDTDEEGILDYGLLEIDDAKGKIRRGNMVEVIGPPKGGKTTLVTFLAERALSQGLNVAVWPLEGTAAEWKSLITALMVRRNKLNNGMSLNKKDILERSPKLTQDEKTAIQSAQFELFNSPDRGKLSFIDGACYVEDMEDVLKYHYENKNTYDVLVIDSPVNVLSRFGTKKKNERISECYMKLKSYVSKKMKVHAICLCTAQIKQEVIDYIRSHPDEELDVTAGGESAETIRTPDEVLGVFSTKQERDMNRMRIYDVASRHSKSFDTMYVHCELGCGYFESRRELNE